MDKKDKIYEPFHKEFTTTYNRKYDVQYRDWVLHVIEKGADVYMRYIEGGFNKLTNEKDLFEFYIYEYENIILMVWYDMQGKVCKTKEYIRNMGEV